MSDTPSAITLASASPRRRELLGYLGLAFRTAASDAEELDHPPPEELSRALPALDLPPLDHPTLRAWRKADAACAHAPRDGIIGADTIVVLDGVAINKPADAADARRMLRLLSGRAHTVYTGLCVLVPQPEEGGTGDAGPSDRRPRSVVLGPWSVFLDLVATEVLFRDLSDAAIDAYVATGEPLDKAGAYGAQGRGALLIASVAGSYTNVVGLPLVNLHRLLTDAGVTGLVEPGAAYRRWLAAQGKEPLPCPPTFP
jgi:septum formation protein